METAVKTEPTFHVEVEIEDVVPEDRNEPDTSHNVAQSVLPVDPLEMELSETHSQERDPSQCAQSRQQKTQTGKKQCVCFCSYKAESSSLLSMHVREIHGSVNKYACYACNYKTSNVKDLLRHTSSTHVPREINAFAAPDSKDDCFKYPSQIELKELEIAPSNDPPHCENSDTDTSIHPEKSFTRSTNCKATMWQNTAYDNVAIGTPVSSNSGFTVRITKDLQTNATLKSGIVGSSPTEKLDECTSSIINVESQSDPLEDSAMISQDCDPLGNFERETIHVVEKSSQAFEISGTRADEESKLKEHSRVRILNVLFVCDLCPRRFTNKKSLNLHKIQVHAAERPFACDMCPSVFSYKRSLEQHKRIHVYLRKTDDTSKGRISYDSNDVHGVTASASSHIQGASRNSHEMPIEEFSLKVGLSKSSSLGDGVVMSDSDEDPLRIELNEAGNEPLSDPLQIERSPPVQLESEKLVNCQSHRPRKEERLKVIGEHRQAREPPCSDEHADALLENPGFEVTVTRYVNRAVTSDSETETSKCVSLGLSAKLFEPSDLTSSIGLNEVNLEPQSNPLQLEDCEPLGNSEIDKFHVEKSDKCDITGSRTLENTELRGNLSVEAEDKPFACDVCHERFSHKKTLDRHKMVHSVDLPFACDVCPRRYSFQTRLDRHKMVHSGEKPFACDLCSQRFPFKRGLEHHKRVHSVEKPFTCDVCRLKFYFKKNLARHIKEHSRENALFACDVCSRRFFVKNRLERHKMSHSTEKPFSCDLCPRRFSYKTRLDRHKMEHSGEKPLFACDACPRRFPYKNFLDHHKRVHSVEKPFACDLCPRRYSYKKNLKRHKMDHPVENSFACDVCPRTFPCKISLDNHKMVHSGEKPFACDLCPRRFSYKKNWERHEMDHRVGKVDKRHHSGKRQFACIFCNYTARGKDAFDIHVTNHHVLGNRDETSKDCFEQDGVQGETYNAPSQNQSTSRNSPSEFTEKFSLRVGLSKSSPLGDGVVMSDSSEEPLQIELDEVENETLSDPLQTEVSSCEAVQLECDGRKKYQSDRPSYEEHLTLSGEHRQDSICGFEHADTLLKKAGFDVPRNSKQTVTPYSETKPSKCLSLRLSEKVEESSNLASSSELNEVKLEPQSYPLQLEEGEIISQNCSHTFEMSGSGTRDKSVFREQSRNHPQGNPFKCDACFHTASKNMKLQTGWFVCNVCSLGFPHKKSLDGHNSVVHSREQPFASDVVHTKERPFACAFCSYSHAQKCYVDVHTKNYCCLTPPGFTSLNAGEQVHICKKDETADGSSQRQGTSQNHQSVFIEEFNLKDGLSKCSPLRNDVAVSESDEDPLRIELDEVENQPLSDPKQMELAKLELEEQETFLNDTPRIEMKRFPANLVEVDRMELIGGRGKNTESPSSFEHADTSSIKAEFKATVTRDVKPIETDLPKCLPYGPNEQWNLTPSTESNEVKLEPQNDPLQLKEGKVSQDHEPSHDSESDKVFATNKSDVCEMSDFITREKSEHKEHSRVHVEDKRFACDVCHQRFSHKKILDKHTMVHSGEKPLACDLRPRTFSCKKNLKQHKKYHPEEKPFACNLCSRTFPYKTSLDNHKMIHSGERPFACYLCDYKAKQKGMLVNHMKTQHSKEDEADKRELCPLCDYKTSRKRLLKVHLRTHSGESVYGCDMCHMIFSKKISMDTHRRRIHPERYKCNICDYRTKYKWHLGLHKSTHAPTKPISCALCDYRTTNIAYLGRHTMECHFGKRRFCCDLCEYTTLNEGHFSLHKIKHCRIFGCSECHFTTKVEAEWNFHTKSFHGRDKQLVRTHDAPIPLIDLTSETPQNQSNASVPGSDVEEYFCYACDYKAPTAAQVGQHVLSGHKVYLVEPTASTTGGFIGDYT